MDQKLNIGFDELLPVKSTVPVDLLIIDTLPVGLSLKIPVDLDVPVLPLKTKAKISFNGQMLMFLEWLTLLFLLNTHLFLPIF